MQCKRIQGMNTYSFACGPERRLLACTKDNALTRHPSDVMNTQQQEPLLARRSAGVCLHITSLPGDYGIGEIGHNALSFIEKMKQMGLGVWQFLPTGPTAYGDSPYQPLSTFAGNELLIDIEELVNAALLKRHELAALRSLPTERVDYAALIPAKNALLRLAAGRFDTHAPAAMKTEFQQFLHENDGDWLHDYALFRILKSRHAERPWPEWDSRYVQRDPAAIAAIEGSEAADIQAIKIIQFLFDSQWRRLRAYAAERGIRLFGDLPICIALDSADAWANPEMLQIDRSGRPDNVAGVPPDYFSEDGQLWGNPLYAWEAHAATGYQWWVRRLAASTQLVDMVRIDHFRGFEAYWSVPASAHTARHGAWLPGPGDAIFDAMKSAFGHLPIVAEDLGVITPEVEALRDRHAIPGMVVLQFDTADSTFDPRSVPENCVCYTGTHDNDTTRGWFNGSPDDKRTAAEIAQTQQNVLRLTGGSPETVHDGMVNLAFSTNARLAIAPMQDYLGLGSEARINTPGTPAGNWRWRVDKDALSDRFCANVSEKVHQSDRSLAN